jgi:hypothetical protein
MRKTTIGLLVLSSMFIVALGVNSYVEGQTKTGEESDNQFQTIQGKVASLSMRALTESLSSTALGMSEKDLKTAVILTLDGKPDQDYRILVADFLNIEGFTDLKGKDKLMGGALILSDLQKRLVGKNITLKVRKIGTEENQEVFSVTGLEILREFKGPEKIEASIAGTNSRGIGLKKNQS